MADSILQQKRERGKALMIAHPHLLPHMRMTLRPSVDGRIGERAYQKLKMTDNSGAPLSKEKIVAVLLYMFEDAREGARCIYGIEMRKSAN